MIIRAGILTISDKGSRGERVDTSGAVIRDMISATERKVVKYEIVPDEAPMIAAKLKDWADSGEVDVILTTGGTGLGPRDVTPEATLSVIDKTVPGFAEVMRVKTFDAAPVSILSRAVSGARKKCLIINLPGSPKAVRECLDVIIIPIIHGVEMLTGAVTEHAHTDHPES
ncbi:MAG: MogA/MoaB family molybdenum cofactor biosynthesis protein [Chloroflexota bacterium]